MLCKYCGKQVELVPSAQERAARFGGKPSDYTRLFEYHADCLIAHRNQQTSALIAKLNEAAYLGRQLEMWAQAKAQGIESDTVSTWGWRNELKRRAGSDRSTHYNYVRLIDGTIRPLNPPIKRPE